MVLGCLRFLEDRKIWAHGGLHNGLCGFPGGHLVMIVHGLLVSREDVPESAGPLPLPPQHESDQNGICRQQPLRILGPVPLTVCGPEQVLHPWSPDPPPVLRPRPRPLVLLHLPLRPASLQLLDPLQRPCCLLGILQLAPQLQNLPFRYHCWLLPLGLRLLLHPLTHVGIGGQIGDRGGGAVF